MKKIRGFTLIELIVVIAIIGVLSAVLTPMFMGAAKDARYSKYQTQGRHVYEAAQLALTAMHNTGTGVQPDMIYTGGPDGIGHASGQGDADLNKYLGSSFTGYFGFKTDSAGIGCSFAVWSDHPLTATDITMMTNAEVMDSLGTSLPRGCYYPQNDVQETP